MKKSEFLKRRYLLNKKEIQIRFIRIAAVFLITAVSSAQQLGNGFAVNVPDLTQPIKSGIYELNSADYVNGDGSSSWYHLFVMRHSNQGNNYQLQLSSSYTENDRLFFRKIADTQGSVWNELATRGTNNFIGNQTISGNVGIGTSTPATKLSVLGGISKLTETGVDGAFDNLIKYGHKSDLESATNYANRWHGIDATITAGLAEHNKLKFRLYSGGTTNVAPVDVMTLVGNGRVGIGTSNPDSKLTVAGNIHAQEVKVTVNAGAVPDYVFANDYKLKSLEEVEAYIRQNKHLPEIPSASDVEKNGLMLAEMNLNLLKKMEEMTLYMIEQNKEITNLKKENETLKSFSERLSKLEKQLSEK
ncbi:hypothetical protein [Flavobacterium sp. T12S277]|uniref:hypothetical protein n=1 Tax=Flavobacterium sp. T12S277 TaxID=3402752 RepID=UPI003AE585A7